MARRYTRLGQSNRPVLDCLKVLADTTTSSAQYRLAMRQAGTLLADALSKVMHVRGKIIHVAFSSEDADFIASGFVERLEDLFAHVRIACFWNKVEHVFNLPWLKQASIIREYYDNFPGEADLYVFIKSVFDAGEATTLNLGRLSEDAGEGPICVAAPVMFMDAAKREIENRKKLLTFAFDDALDARGYVSPGIGGDVCQRLDLEREQTDFIPAIITTRLFNPDRLVPSGGHAAPRYIEEPVKARRIAKSFGKRGEEPEHDTDYGLGRGPGSAR